MIYRKCLCPAIYVQFFSLAVVDSTYYKYIHIFYPIATSNLIIIRIARHSLQVLETLQSNIISGVCIKAEELIRARRVELNIAATIEKMELCLPLLTTYSKLKLQVEAKRLVLLAECH